MRTMLWKELRENFKWALLALLALTAAELYTLSSPRQSYSEDFRELTLCSSAFLLTTAFGCSAIGIALALVQILPELRRDQWAALLHRPVPRSTIFFGKVFAGLLLYAGATVIPFIVSAVYVAMPSQFAAPLVPGMLIPGLSDLLLGPVFYFATLLLCLQRGSWWGSRAAIGLSAIPIFVEHLVAGWPFLLPIVSALVYLAAAWGAMLSNGSGQSRSLIARLALPLVALLGAETAVLLLLAGLQLLPKSAGPFTQVYSNFEVEADGKVYLATQTGDGTQNLTDMQGNDVPGAEIPQLIQNPIELLPLSWQFQGSKLRDAYFRQSPRALANYLSEFDETQGKEIWYLLRGRNYFVGYDKLSRRAVGICDADGFKPPGAAPRPFPQPLEASIMIFRDPRIFWMGSQIYMLNFPDRSMVAFNSGGEPIFGANPLVPNYLNDKPLYIAVALATQLRLFDNSGVSMLFLPYPHDPHVWSSLSIGTNDTGDRIYLESQASVFPWNIGSGSKSPPPPAYLDVFDSQGHLLVNYQRSQTNITVMPGSWTERLSLYLSPFVPALIGTAYFNLFPSQEIDDVEVLNYFTLPKPRLQGVAPGDLAILFGLDVLMGIIAFAWARREGIATRRATGWAIFTACFGLPGLVTFRVAADWPIRARCPVCGTKRPIQANECPGCHQAWPVPTPTGIEIFEGEKAAVFAGPPYSARST
jgi:ABC-type transport system involved in multi-copper enzyme maturation permease subunit